MAGDSSVEANETFLVNLSNAVGGTIARAQGTATITNDDSAAVAPAVVGPVPFYVSPSGNDANGCTFALPCRQIRKALTLVTPGATILVADGSYLGFDVNDVHGTAAAPITIKAKGTGAQVTVTTDRADNRDTIFVTFSSYIVIDGLRSSGANRAAVRVDQSPNVTIRNGVFGNNATWGIFTDFSDDLLLESNECFGSGTQHGIYVSNSGDRPIVRDNRSHDNAGGGIQLNADLSAGGDGIITGALIEQNVIYNNGTAGGAARSTSTACRTRSSGTTSSTTTTPPGSSNFQIDGAQGPQGMQILHNTIDMAVGRPMGAAHHGTRRAPTSSGTTSSTTSTPSAAGSPTAAPADVDQHRQRLQHHGPRDARRRRQRVHAGAMAGPGARAALVQRDTCLPLGRPPRADYHLKAGSPAIDKGPALANATGDMDRNVRPWGAASDIGADEVVPANLTTTPLVTGLSSPTSMHLAPDGRIFVSQQGGQLRVFKAGALLPTPFVSLTRGLERRARPAGRGVRPRLRHQPVRLRLLHGARARRPTTA